MLERNAFRQRQQRCGHRRFERGTVDTTRDRDYGFGVDCLQGSDIRIDALLLGGAGCAHVHVDEASAGTVLVVVPAEMTVGVTVVACAGEDKSLIAITRRASSTAALMPFSGSSPAWAARPATWIRYSDTPLRTVFSSPPSPPALENQYRACRKFLDEGPRRG